MAFTYDGNPGGNARDFIRFTVGDTKEATAVLQDTEIEYIIDTYPNNVNRQLAIAFRQCATHYGAQATKKALGPQSEDASKRLEYYMQMADKYERNLTFSGTPPLPAYQAEKAFEKNMMGNEN